MRVMVRTIGNIPDSWGKAIIDYDGQPTTDHTKGQPLELWDEVDQSSDLSKEYGIDPRAILSILARFERSSGPSISAN